MIYYTAADTYPSEAYYEEKIVALPGNNELFSYTLGVLFFLNV